VAVPFTAGVSRALQTASTSRDVVNWPPMNPLANPTADANRYMEDSMKREDNRKLFNKLNIQRHKDMASQTAKLLTLANQLKDETDRSSANAPSIISVREAEQIEKLAHDVREKMGATAGN
jgi:2,4-dienoyl-CoA reductase-like NADH-dependent reductase (Old Yellow Enzyme family)